jgi:hypothetical protein
MVNELEIIWKELVMTQIKKVSKHMPAESDENLKTFSEGNQCPT